MRIRLKRNYPLTIPYQNRGFCQEMFIGKKIPVQSIKRQMIYHVIQIWASSLSEFRAHREGTKSSWISDFLRHDDNTDSQRQQRFRKHPTRKILKMSATLEAARPAGQTKKFSKGERHIPHASERAGKWYPAEDESKPKTVRFDILWEVEVFWLSSAVLRGPVAIAPRNPSRSIYYRPLN